MSTHNIGFNEEINKIISDLSSNTHVISSGVKAIYISIHNIVYYGEVTKLPLNYHQIPTSSFLLIKPENTYHNIVNDTSLWFEKTCVLHSMVCETKWHRSAALLHRLMIAFIFS